MTAIRVILTILPTLACVREARRFRPAPPAAPAPRVTQYDPTAPRDAAIRRF